MNFIAEINIMPLKEILDPQGKAVKLGLDNLGVNQVADVRIGKHIVMQLSAEDEAAAHQIVDKACQQLLANMIMEEYVFTIREAN